MKSITKRLFIALRIPPDIRGKIEKISRVLAKKHANIRPCRKEGLHITLHFLGNINRAREEKIRYALKNLSDIYHEIRVTTGTLGAFPDFKDPKVVFLSLFEESGNSMVSLQKSIGRALADITGIDKRRWHPHITLGRAVYKAEISNNFNIPPLRFTMSSFELMQSRLKPGGSEYTVLEKYNLKKQT